MAKLKLNTSRMNPDQLISLAEVVLPKIAPEAPETPPVPNMASKAAAMQTKLNAAKAANNAYKAALAAMPGLKVARDFAADDLRLEHSALGAALEAETRGDPVLLSQTGYGLAGSNAPATTPPGIVDNLRLTAGELDGALDGAYDPEELANMYEVQITTTDPVNGPWTTALNPSASTFQLTGLTSGSRVWVRVRAHGSKGPGPWSDPATKIVP